MNKLGEMEIANEKSVHVYGVAILCQCVQLLDVYKELSTEK